jgi:hypothetical protein
MIPAYAGKTANFLENSNQSTQYKNVDGSRVRKNDGDLFFRGR